MLKRILLPVLIAAMPVAAYAFKAYVYSPGSSESLAGSDNVRRIEINDGRLTLFHVDGSEESAEAGTWSHIVPRWYDPYSSVEDIAAEINIVFDGNALRVSAPKAVEDIALFDVKGRKMYSVKPDDCSCAVDLSALEQGVYIARVQCGDNSRTIKFAKQ